MALSGEEANIIRTTFAPVRSAPSTHSRLFIILFNEDPQIRKLFKAFENVPAEELPTNRRLKAHAMSVVTLLGGFVDCLDDTETMVEMIQQMAARHYKRKVPLPYFDTLGVAVIKWLKEIGGEAINDAAVAAWTKLYTALVSIVKGQYAELDKAA